MVLVFSLTAVLLAVPSIVWAQDDCPPGGCLPDLPDQLERAKRSWTTVGSAGTVDEESLLFVTLASATARVREHAPAGTIGVIRYNVVAVEGLFGGGINLTARFFDGEDTDRVLINLKRISDGDRRDQYAGDAGQRFGGCIGCLPGAVYMRPERPV